MLLFQNINVFYRIANPESFGPSTIDVLFLHGMAYKSETWTQLSSKEDPSWNSITLVAGAGHKAVAVDLPGKLLASYPDDAFMLLYYNFSFTDYTKNHREYRRFTCVHWIWILSALRFSLDENRLYKMCKRK